MKKIFCFLFLYIIANLAAIAQQDPQFTFNKMTQLFVNPGFAGNDEVVTGVLLNRWQWTSFPGAPETHLLSVGAATELFGVKSGVGINIMSDNFGNSNNISLSLDYALRKNTAIGMLGIGASVGFYNWAISADWEVPDDPNHDIWDENDILVPQSNVSRMALDLGLGLFLKGDDYYVGASMTHINQASIVFEEQARIFLVRHYYMSAGYNIGLSDPLFEIQPSVLFKTDMVSYQADMTVDLVYNKRFSAGLNYRINDAIGILLGFELANGMRIGYAYDIMTSAMAAYGNGSHEFYLGYSFDLGKKKNKKYKSVRFL